MCPYPSRKDGEFQDIWNKAMNSKNQGKLQNEESA